MTTRMKRPSLYMIRLVHYFQKELAKQTDSRSEAIKLKLTSSDLKQQLGYPDSIELKNVRFQIRRILTELNGIVDFEETLSKDKNKVVESTFEIKLNHELFQKDCELLEPTHLIG